MKKLLSILALLFTLPVYGQTIGSNQIKLKTDGGLTGDATKNLAVGIVRASSAPSSPVTGQLWCDTTLSPCTLKQYTGSVWVAPQVNAAITTQTDVTSFPGSPVDGQIFFSKAEKMLWIYNSTTALWYSIGTSLTTSGANIQDVYTADVIAPPGAMTVAASATAGSMAAGAYSYKLTCRNANGGETTGGTVSANVTVTLNKSVDFSNIPTCGTGGVTRNIYRSKLNATSGPWYFEKAIADNSTTTGVNSGTADASNVGLAPDINFSGALPGSWTVLNIASFTNTGGCGVTGASRSSMVCYNGANATGSQLAQATDGANLRASLDISSYSSGDYTIQLRYKLWSQNGDTYPNHISTAIFGMRYGTADNAQRFYIHMGQITGTNEFTSPFTSSNRGTWFGNLRTTSGGTSYSNGNFQMNNPFPQVSAFPYYLRIVRRSGNLGVYHSADGVIWTAVTTAATTANNTTLATSFNAGAGSNVLGSSSLNRVEIPFGNSTSGLSAGTGPWIEIDSFTITVN